MHHLILWVLASTILTVISPGPGQGARADMHPEHFQPCEAAPEAGPVAPTERRGQVVMAFVLFLEKQGRESPVPEYTVEGKVCLAETFDVGDSVVQMNSAGFHKKLQTLHYRIVARNGGETREILVLYNGMVSAVFEANHFFVSETRGAATTVYEVFSSVPTHRTLRDVATDILQGTAEPLITAEWQPGEPELVIIAYDAERLS